MLSTALRVTQYKRTMQDERNEFTNVLLALLLLGRRADRAADSHSAVGRSKYAK